MKLMLYPILALLFLSCLKFESPVVTVDLSPEFDEYWYSGQAEVNSYKLSQARYGEMRDGTAVLIFVTEPFSPTSMTKADRQGTADVPVLKLNFTKNFNTGIYPYSMMTSTFLPVNKPDQSIKISSSAQEWCGHSYMQMENKKKLDFSVSSYFQGESSEFTLDKNILEDDLWSMIRIAPDKLPMGEELVIPSFFHLRLAHIETKAYKAELSKSASGSSTTYKIDYPEIKRTLEITYETAFPHRILSWTESFESGFGSSRTPLTSSGELIKSMKTDYWTKNSNKDERLRNELGLE